jgi:hypothetical protein
LFAKQRILPAAKQSQGTERGYMGLHNVSTVQGLPIRVALVYFASTFLVFVFSPFDWPVDDWVLLIGFLSACMGLLWAGFRFAVTGRPVQCLRLQPRRIIVIAATAALAVLFIAAPIYTGKMPWQVFEALRDQGAAYSSLQEQLELTSGSRGPIALLRILTWPFVFAALPLGILHWAELSARLRAAVVVVVLSIVTQSILRGTDRESADLLTVAVSTLGVLSARRMLSTGTGLVKLLWGAKYRLAAGLMLLMALGILFVERKEQRLGNAATLCVGASDQNPTGGICADFDYPPFVQFDLDDRYRMAVMMAAAYLGQGYYGLSLALQMSDFHPTWGIGHAPFLTALYANITGNEEFYKRSYTYRLREIGWSDESQWSTMFPWVANDISFFGAAFLMLLIGTTFGAAWRDAVFAQDDRAAIVFALLCIMLVYLPANSQVTLVPDHYFALLTWLGLWFRGRRRSPRLRNGQHDRVTVAPTTS